MVTTIAGQVALVGVMRVGRDIYGFLGKRFVAAVTAQASRHADQRRRWRFLVARSAVQSGGNMKLV